MDIRQFTHRVPIGCLDTHIGNLSVYSLTVGSQNKFEKQVGADIAKVDAEKFVRNLAMYICHRTDALPANLERPNDPTLTMDDVEKLRMADLENIAGIYLEGNAYLYKKISPTKIIAGVDAAADRNGQDETEHPRNPNETNIAYLHRISIIEKERRYNLIKDMMKPLNLGVFSGGLASSIKSNLGLGHEINKILGEDSFFKTASALTESGFFKDSPAYSPPVIEPILPEIDFASFRVDKDKPIREVTEKLEKLIEISSKMTPYLIAANDNQVKIASEIKASGDSTEKFSHINLGISKWVFALTVISLMSSLVIAAYTIYHSNESSRADEAKFEERTRSLSETLNFINGSIQSGNRISERIEQNKISDAKTQDRINLQEAKLREQEEMLKSQEMKIRKLEEEMKVPLSREKKRVEN